MQTTIKSLYIDMMMGGAVVWMVAVSLLKLEAKEVQIWNTDTARVWLLSGGVKVTSEEVTILAPQGVYYEESEMGYLKDTVVFSLDSTLIVSDTLWYWEKENRFRFLGFSSVTQPGRFLGAKSLDVRGDSLFLSGPLLVDLLEKEVSFTGDTGFFNLRTHFGRLWNSAEARILKADSIFLTADTFFFKGDTLWATGSVNMRGEQFSLEGDTLYYFFGGEEFGVLWGRSHLRGKTEEVTASSFSFHFEKGRINLFTASGDVKIRSEREDGSTDLESGYAEFALDSSGKLRELSAISGVKGSYLRKKRSEEGGRSSS